MGMMIMAESFDEWKAAKVQNGYHKVFDEWVEKDLVNLIHQYRNNPSVVMWCIGNEVPDQWNGDRGPKLSRFLQDICHREDPTRPVTQGMDAPDAVVNNNMAAVMDVAGFNYRPHKYQENYKNFRNRSSWVARQLLPLVHVAFINSLLSVVRCRSMTIISLHHMM